MPYITALNGSTVPTAVPLFNDMHHNFNVANYGADGGCFDNDDGSSYYKVRTPWLKWETEVPCVLRTINYTPLPHT